MPARLSIVVLTEDSAPDARATIEALARKMLPLVVPNCRVHDRIAFLPTNRDDEEGMFRCIWKGTDPRHRDARVRLYRYIARKLCEHQTFVLFHVDGDTPWEQRARSENVAKIGNAIILIEQAASVGQNNVRRLRSNDESKPVEPVKPDFNQFLPIVPFYTIESWLYQNIQTAADICRREHGGKHVHTLHSLEQRRHELDEIVKPAESLALCIGKKYNLELASCGFPARPTYEVEKSFYDTVEKLRSCAKLVDALKSTVETWG